jgi:hypothetical protein
MNFTNENLIKYYNNGFFIVSGWVHREIFPLIEFLDELPINNVGGVTEIGVHHGRLFILLNQLIEEQYTSYAIDIFDKQYLNTSHSGNGNLEVFKLALERYCRHSVHNTVCISGDSADASLNILGTIPNGSMRFVSVDGAHTAEHTMNDLVLASSLVHNEGVVLLDDIIHSGLLGVLEGTVSFLNTKPTLMPFAMGYNKLFFAKSAYRQYYYDALLNSEFNKGTQRFFGHDIVMLGYMEPIN